MSWFLNAPLPLVGIVLLALLFAAVELGYQGHGWLKADRSGSRHEGPDYLLSAVLGLLALLLGFTFSLALNRYETRRDLVVQEANAIGTTWLRASLLREPLRNQMLSQLRSYADARITWSAAENGDAAPTAALQQRIWAGTGAAMRTDPSAQLSRGLMDAVNQTFDLASSRAAEREAHVPERVLSILLLYALLSVTMLGYIQASGGRAHRIPTALLLVLLTLAITIILDLDRPRDGAIQVSQKPLEDLRASMK
jgi:hypothetical protein